MTPDPLVAFLNAFLNARLDEDEAAAKAAIWSADSGAAEWIAGARSDEAWYVVDGYEEAVVYHVRAQAADDKAVAVHIARHDPARVLREVEAGRAVLAAHQPGEFDRYGRIEIACTTCVTGHEAYMDDDGPDPWPCATVRHLASIWSDHEDYRQEWKP